MNDRERYQRGRDVWLAVFDLPTEERAERLKEICGDDSLLHAELVALFDEAQAATALFAGGKGIPGLEQLESAPEPHRIGGYRILGELGRGGMGVVYRAEQEHPRRVVALKVVRAELRTPAMLRRFRREAEVLGALHHPGIAQIYEASVGSGDGAPPFIALELVEGRPITRYALEQGLGRAACIELWIQVCRAVQHAHQKGVIHRDLKPGNVLVDHSGRPRVLDFGISKLVGSGRASVGRETATGFPLGTLPYMSPEQCGAETDTDARSDVHALGVLGFELLTGELPYTIHRDLDWFQVARVVRDEPARRVGTIDRALAGSDLELVLARALEKDREQRYQTAAELAGDLERYLRKEPVLVRPQSIGYLLRKLVARHRAVSALAMGLLLLTLSAATILAVQGAELRKRTRSATTAEAIASRRLLDAVDLSSALIFEIHDALLNLPQSTPARLTVLDSARRFLDGLRLEGSLTDRRAALVAVEGFLRMGDVLGGPFSGNLGGTKPAEEAYGIALGIAEELHDLDPAGSGVQAALASALERAGSMSPNTGDAEQGLSALRRATSLRAQLVAQSGGEVDALADHWNAQRLLAESLGRVNAGDEGLEHARRTLEEVRLLQRSHPDHEELERLGALCYRTLGDLLFERGKYSEALDQHLEAVDVYRARLASSPESRQARTDLATGLGLVVNALRMVGPDERLMELASESLDLRRQLSESDSSDAQARRGLMIGLNQCGEAAFEQGRFDEARQQFVEAQRVAAELARVDPGNLELVRDQYVAAVRLGRVAEAQDRLPDALEHARTSIEIMERLCQIDPANTDHRRDRAIALLSAAEFAVRLAEGGGIHRAQLADLYLESRERFAAVAEMLRLEPGLLSDEQLAVEDLLETIRTLDELLRGG